MEEDYLTLPFASLELPLSLPSPQTCMEAFGYFYAHNIPWVITWVTYYMQQSQPFCLLR